MKIAIVCAAIGWICLSTGNFCHAQTPPANPSGLSPDLQEVIKLSQSHMGDKVIINFIKNSGKSYRLGADDIIYLNNQGVSQGVISTLQTASSANPAPLPGPSYTTTPTPLLSQPSPETVATSQPAPQPQTQAFQVPPAPLTEAPQAGPEINFQYFHDQLAPFGTWIDVGGTMYWHPDQAIAANPDWRPYYDMGQWVQTDNGLYWQSDYTWGDIPFHYGRWVLNPRLGWLWVPDYTWGPAWVFWRQAEGDAAIGWAPLPVGAVFVDGVFFFNGVRVGLDFDFGLGESCFVFVGYDHFHEGFFLMRGHPYRFAVPRERVHEFYGRSVIRNDFHKDEHGRFVNNGIGRERLDRVAQVTHHPIEKVSFEERPPVGNREKPAKEQPGMGGTGKSVSKVYRPPTPTKPEHKK